MKKTSKTTQNTLIEFRKQVKKEIGKKRIRTSFSFRLDNRTQKLILCYTVPGIVIDSNGISVEKRVNKEKYLKNYKFPLGKNEYNDFISNLIKFEDFVVEEERKYSKSIHNKVESLDNIISEYLKIDKRKSGKKLSKKSRSNDKQSLNYFLDFFKRNNNPNLILFKRDELDKVISHKNIHDISEKDIEIFRDRVSVDRTYKGKMLKGWSETTVHTHLTRIKVFFNYIQNQRIIDVNPFSHINLGTVKSNNTIFKDDEFLKVLDFISNKKDDNNWSWFIPILQVGLFTGSRLSETVFMKYSDIDFNIREWKFYGKGEKQRLMRFDNEDMWNSLVKLMTDENGNIRTDRTYVFNNHRYRDIRPYSIDGVSKKFKKMIKYLKINPKLSFHSCRRYFITLMLRQTKSDINLVMNLVGHSTVKMVMRYNKFVLQDSDQVNIDVSKLSVKNGKE